MDIKEYLSQQDVRYEVHEHPASYTAQEMAAEEHVSGKKAAKPVIVKTADRYAMCVLPASAKLDLSKAARALHEKQATLADETEMANLFPDVEIGAEPPFGNLYDMPTLIDESLAQAGQIVFQAGTHRHCVHMDYSDYERLANGQTSDLASRL